MPITFFIVTSFMKRARRSQAVADADIDFEFVEYGMTNRLWEIEKFLYTCLIFIFIPFLTIYYYLAGVALFMIIKLSTGGLHVSDWQLGFIKIPAVWNCFFWTLMTFVAGTYILPTFIPINHAIRGVMALFSIIVTYLISPVRNAAEEELADKSKDKQKRLLATVFTMAFWFLIMISGTLPIGRFIIPTSVLAWLLFINNIQMLMVVYNENKK